jgi:hypothetical protein
MKRLILLLCLLPAQRPYAPVATYHIDVVVGKYDSGTCIRNGGMWVVGETSLHFNELAGCVEHVPKPAN